MRQLAAGPLVLGACQLEVGFGGQLALLALVQRRFARAQLLQASAIDGSSGGGSRGSEGEWFWQVVNAAEGGNRFVG